MLTTNGFDAETGIKFVRIKDYLYECQAPNSWMTKQIYIEVTRFGIRLHSNPMRGKKLFVDDICTGHQSELVKSLVYNAGFEYTSIPGGGTGLYIRFSYNLYICIYVYNRHL